MIAPFPRGRGPDPRSDRRRRSRTVRGGSRTCRPLGRRSGSSSWRRLVRRHPGGYGRRASATPGQVVRLAELRQGRRRVPLRPLHRAPILTITATQDDRRRSPAPRQLEDEDLDSSPAGNQQPPAPLPSGSRRACSLGHRPLAQGTFTTSTASSRRTGGIVRQISRSTASCTLHPVPRSAAALVGEIRSTTTPPLRRSNMAGTPNVLLT